jgi:hypothetical protein
MNILEILGVLFLILVLWVLVSIYLVGWGAKDNYKKGRK